MKKSELRTLIKEVLYEELLREDDNAKVINEDGIQSTIDRSIMDNLCGIELLDVDGKTIYTKAPNNLSNKRTTQSNDMVTVYTYVLASGIPEDKKEEVKKNAKFKAGYAKVTSMYKDHEGLELEHKLSFGKGAFGLDLVYTLTMIPDWRNGYRLHNRYHKSVLRGDYD